MSQQRPVQDNRQHPYSNKAWDSANTMQLIMIVVVVVGGVFANYMTTQSALIEVKTTQEIKFAQLFEDIKDTKAVNAEYDRKIQTLHNDIEDLRLSITSLYSKSGKR